VLETLGVADAGLILDATETVIDKDPSAALLTVQSLADTGRDYQQFMRDLAGHLRHLLVIKTVGEVPDSFAVTTEHSDRLSSQAERASQGELLRAIDLLAAAIAAAKDGSEPRLQLEVGLLKATQPQADQSLQALMFRIDQLEARLAGGAAAPVQPEAAPARPDPEPATPAPQGGAPVSSPRASGDQPARVTAVAAGGGGSAVVAAAIEARPDAEEAQAEPTPEDSPMIDLERVTSIWSGVADAVREQNGMVAALVAEAVPSALDGDKLTVSFPADAAFLKKKAEANRDLVLGALRTLTGRALAVAFELAERTEETGPEALGEDELLQRLVAEFGAEEVFEEAEPATQPQTED
jgi:DNA polymerase-3 subunit gamma/tau